MNADAFRHVYAYHFAENRSLWEAHIVPLTQQQFTQPVNYSLGSVRNHIVHLIDVDNGWFSGLRGVQVLQALDPNNFHDRDVIRAHWDTVEETMRAYLADLRDDMLQEKPFTDDEDKALILWQALLQVINHGTDHRAQLLRILHDLGAKTTAQDYIFYAYDHP